MGDEKRQSVAAPPTAEAARWIIDTSEWVPRAELARMRAERDREMRERDQAVGALAHAQADRDRYREALAECVDAMVNRPSQSELFRAAALRGRETLGLEEEPDAA